MLLVEKETIKEAWETIKTMHLGIERIKEAKIQTLKSGFEIMRKKEAETTNDFVVRLTGIVDKICALSDKVKDTYVVKKFLCVVPLRLLQMVSMIEQFGNLRNMTMEEAICHLKAYKEQIGGGGDNDEHVLLTRTEWKAKEVKARGESSSNVKGRGDRGVRGRGRGGDSG